MAEDFIKNVEDFTCENCGAEVVGNGYTNHCPKCLYSKHVDIHPGDRASECGGMMEPRSIDKRNGDTYIVLFCKKCSHMRRNKVADNDDEDLIIELSTNTLDGKN